jgi:hypothetical protein
MELSPDDIKEFVDAWEADFAERLTGDVAQAEARRLLRFFATFVNTVLSQRKDAGHEGRQT